MTYYPQVPTGPGRILNSTQQAAIDKALAGGSVTEAELGALRAAAIYADTVNAQRAQEALAANTAKKDRRR